MKRCVLLFLIVVLFFLCAGFSDGGEFVDIEISARGKVVLKNRYPINPNLTTSDLEVLQNSINTYGEIGILDYMYGSFGSDLLGLYDSFDNVGIVDCVRFIPKSREKFVYEEAVSSEWVERGKVAKEVFENHGSKKINIELSFVKGKSRYTREELLSCTQKISSFTTSYTYSSEGRKHNIGRAVSYISGYVLDSGDTFSFNSIVGKRTKDRGFQEAKVIVGGSYVDGVGGGVCQVATTLYNASIRAGVRVDNCVRHSLAPSYVDLSFDAMVSEWSDLVFTNTHDTPLFIEAIADGERLTVNFYGKKQDYDLKFESITKEVVRHSLFDGTNGDRYRNGYKSEGYMLTIKDGVMIKREKIRSDYYAPYEVSLLKAMLNEDQTKTICFY